MMHLLHFGGEVNARKKGFLSNQRQPTQVTITHRLCPKSPPSYQRKISSSSQLLSQRGGEKKREIIPEPFSAFSPPGDLTGDQSRMIIRRPKQAEYGRSKTGRKTRMENSLLLPPQGLPRTLATSITNSRGLQSRAQHCIYHPSI